MTGNESINTDILQIGTEDPNLNTTSIGAQQGTTMTIDGAGYNIIGDNKGGITVAESQILNVNNVAEIGGFNGEFVTNLGITTFSATTNNVAFTDENQDNIHNEGTLNLKANVDKTITFNGTITGGDGVADANEVVTHPFGRININADAANTGTVQFNDVVTGNRIVQSRGTVEFDNVGSATLTYDDETGYVTKKE